MGDKVFNVTLGRIRTYAELPAANDAFIMVLLKSAGLEADEALVDHDTLAAVLAATNDECDVAGYAREVLTNVAIAVDDATNRLDIDCDDATFGALPLGNTLTKALICYDPDTTAGTDATIVPITAHDVNIITDGSEVTVAPPAGGFARAQG